VHGFLFLHAEETPPPAEVIERLRPHVDKKKGPVFFASLFDGEEFQGFVHFAADGLLGLVDFTGDELFEAGVHSDYAIEGSVYYNGLIPMGPKRKSPRYCAICSVDTTEKPKLVLDAIAEEFGGDEPLVGASRVIGGFPLLVELGSDDEGILTEAIERLRNVAGVGEVAVGTTDTGPAEDRTRQEEEPAPSA
jgi:hypothetical protein